MIDEKVLIERLKGEVIALEDNFGDLVECIPSEVVFELVNQSAEETSFTPCYLGSPCEYQNENAQMPKEFWETMSENEIIAEYVKSRFPNILKTADFGLYKIGIGLSKTLNEICKNLQNIDWEAIKECLESVNEQKEQQ